MPRGTALVWTPDPSGRARKGLGNNLARKCLERWNATVGVEEGKNAFQPTGVRVLLMTGSEHTVERRNFENWRVPDQLRWRSENEVSRI